MVDFKIGLIKMINSSLVTTSKFALQPSTDKELWLVFDIETNGFLSEASVVHSIVIKDIETNQLYSYHGDKIGRGLMLLNGASLLVGHNILKFEC